MSPLLRGDRLMADVDTIVGFSLKSRAEGHYLWGRISGQQSLLDTVEWASAELRSAGLADARIETFEGSLTVPVAGEVRLKASASVGAGSQDIVLQSAIAGGRGPSGAVTAPLIWLGRGTSADMIGRDVAGRIAVINEHVDSSLFHTSPGRQQALIRAGAAGVLEILDQPGNMQSFDGDRHGCGTSLCFTLGGEDGYFLEKALSAAARAGVTIEASLSAQSRTDPRAQTANAVATIPGKSPRTIIINAHADAWFTGADDNATGLAALLALARYFRTQPKPERTLVFAVGAGHHTISGIAGFRAAHGADYVANADLVLNLEHIAAGEVARSVMLGSGPQRTTGLPLYATTAAQPKQVGINPASPFVEDLYRQAVTCFGLSLGREVDTLNPGELGGFRGVGAIQTQIIYAGPFYHTSGEAVGSVSPAELERATRFFAYFINAVASASKDVLEGRTAAPVTGCPATP